jgi:hypothetical protein
VELCPLICVTAQIANEEFFMAKRTSKRELIAPRGDKRYIRRDKAGKIKESDDVSRSLSQDGRKKAKTEVKSGQGDKGDRRQTQAPTRKTVRGKR